MSRAQPGYMRLNSEWRMASHNPTYNESGMGFSAAPPSAGRFWALIGATFLGFLGIGAVLPALGSTCAGTISAGRTRRWIRDRCVLVSSHWAAACSPVLWLTAADAKRSPSWPDVQLRLQVRHICCRWGLPARTSARIFQGLGEACLYTGAAACSVELAASRPQRGSPLIPRSGYLGRHFRRGRGGRVLGSLRARGDASGGAALAGFAVSRACRKSTNPRRMPVRGAGFRVPWSAPELLPGSSMSTIG